MKPDLIVLWLLLEFEIISKRAKNYYWDLYYSESWDREESWIYVPTLKDLADSEKYVNKFIIMTN